MMLFNMSIDLTDHSKKFITDIAYFGLFVLVVEFFMLDFILYVEKYLSAVLADEAGVDHYFGRWA